MSLKESLDNAIRLLRSRGLLVERYVSPGEVAVPEQPVGKYYALDGFSFAKPSSVKGNTHGHGEAYWGDIVIEGPTGEVFLSDTGKGFFHVWEAIPGPGPGDFILEYDTIDDAAEAVLAYYFGDPENG